MEFSIQRQRPGDTSSLGNSPAHYSLSLPSRTEEPLITDSREPSDMKRKERKRKERKRFLIRLILDTVVIAQERGEGS